MIDNHALHTHIVNIESNMNKKFDIIISEEWREKKQSHKSSAGAIS